MMNKLLVITRGTIPYVKELRTQCGSVTACILMQQLEYWFDRHPNGFYKFLSPNGNDLCVSGDTWVEELGFSEDEFRTAFSKIGIAHKSKGQFDQCEDKFNGKFYCSYFNKIQGTTHYFRNNKAVETCLNDIITGNKPIKNINLPVNRQSQFTETDNADLRKQAMPIYVNRQCQFTETDNAHPDTYSTETTTETTTIAQSEKNENYNFEEKEQATIAKHEDSYAPIKEEKKVAAKKEEIEVLETVDEIADFMLENFDEYLEKKYKNLFDGFNSKNAFKYFNRCAVLILDEKYKRKNVAKDRFVIFKFFDKFGAWVVSDVEEQARKNAQKTVSKVEQVVNISDRERYHRYSQMGI